MKQIIRQRTGSLPILLIGLLFALLLLVFLLIEMGATYQNYDYAHSLLQRAANSAVESNINDEYRADRILLLDVTGAEADFRSFVVDDLPEKYTVTITEVTATESPPSLTATGMVSFKTVFSKYGFDDLSFSFSVKATNYELS